MSVHAAYNAMTPPNVPAQSCVGGVCADDTSRRLFTSTKWISMQASGSSRKKELVVSPQGSRLFEQTADQVNAVMIFGAQRTGKSFLMNALCPTNQFKVSSSHESCTQGVDLFPPAPMDGATAGAPAVAWLDVEGQGGKGEAYEVKLAVPLLITSKVCIMNLMAGSVGCQPDSVLSQLGFMISAAKTIGDAADKKAARAERKGAFGHLHIVLRDSDGKRAALEHQLLDPEDVDQLGLSEGDDDEVAKVRRNTIRLEIAAVFESVSVWPLPRPSMRPDMLTSLQDTTSDFQHKVAVLRSTLVQQLAQPKVVGGVPLMGSTTAALAQQIALAMQVDHPVLRPKSMMESVFTAVARNAVQDALQHATEQIEALKASGRLPMAENACAAEFSAIETAALSMFDQRIRSNAVPSTALGAARDDLAQRLALRGQTFRADNAMQNSEAGALQATKAAKRFQAMHEAIASGRTPDLQAGDVVGVLDILGRQSVATVVCAGDPDYIEVSFEAEDSPPEFHAAGSDMHLDIDDKDEAKDQLFGTPSGSDFTTRYASSAEALLGMRIEYDAMGETYTGRVEEVVQGETRPWTFLVTFNDGCEEPWNLDLNTFRVLQLPNALVARAQVDIAPGVDLPALAQTSSDISPRPPLSPSPVSSSPPPAAARSQPPSAGSLFVRELLGSTLLGASGQDVPCSAAFSGKRAVGLYFSAHWCPPCRAFTPQLARQYKAHYEDKGLEIVFVSSDSDQSTFDAYFAQMPWLAVPFSERDAKNRLSKHFEVRGLPTLVIIDPASGAVITKDGRAAVTNDPTGQRLNWFGPMQEPPKLSPCLTPTSQELPDYRAGERRACTATSAYDSVTPPPRQLRHGSQGTKSAGKAQPHAAGCAAGKSWNEFRASVKGKGLSQSEISQLYHAQKTESTLGSSASGEPHTVEYSDRCGGTGGFKSMTASPESREGTTVTIPATSAKVTTAAKHGNSGTVSTDSSPAVIIMRQAEEGEGIDAGTKADKKNLVEHFKKQGIRPCVLDGSTLAMRNKARMKKKADGTVDKRCALYRQQANIMKEEFFKRAKKDLAAKDHVVVAYSGHGAAGDGALELGGTKSEAEQHKARLAPLEFFQRWTEIAAPGKKLTLALDSCYSGNFISFARSERGRAMLKNHPVEIRGASGNATTDGFETGGQLFCHMTGKLDDSDIVDKRGFRSRKRAGNRQEFFKSDAWHGEGYLEKGTYKYMKQSYNRTTDESFSSILQDCKDLGLGGGDVIEKKGNTPKLGWNDFRKRHAGKWTQKELQREYHRQDSQSEKYGEDFLPNMKQKANRDLFGTDSTSQFITARQKRAVVRKLNAAKKEKLEWERANAADIDGLSFDEICEKFRERHSAGWPKSWVPSTGQQPAVPQPASGARSSAANMHNGHEVHVGARGGRYYDSNGKKCCSNGDADSARKSANPGLSWNDFRKSVKGLGLSRDEMSARYQAQKGASSPASAAPRVGSSTPARSAATGGDRGSEMSQQHGAQRTRTSSSETSAKITGRGRSSGGGGASEKSSGAGQTWNEFRSSNKGMGLSRSDMSRLYQAQKSTPSTNSYPRGSSGTSRAGSGSRGGGGGGTTRVMHTGPRGGQYYINSNGNKTYVRK